MKKLILACSMLLFCSIFSYAQYTTAGNTNQGFALNSNTGIYAGGNSLNGFFSKTDSAVETKDANYYLAKSRNMKTAGFCLMGAGVIGLAIGLATFPQDSNLIFPDDKDAAKADRATTITIIGALVLCSSTPFFILSNVNKKKAKLYLNNEKTTGGIPMRTGAITGLTLGISLGK